MQVRLGRTILETIGGSKTALEERSAGILVDQRPNLSTRFSFALEPAPDLEWDLTFAEEARKTGFRVRSDRVMYMLAARTSDEERLRAELLDLVRIVNEKMDP